MITPKQLEEWQAICDAVPPAPWRWEVNKKRKIVELVSTPSPIFTVMAFSRFGMSSAQPEFSVRSKDGIHAVRTKASDAARAQPGREHHQEWFMVIDHPTADFIAAAPSVVPKLIAEVRSLRKHVTSDITEMRSLRKQLRAYQVKELRRRMRDWSEDWYASGWESQLSQRIWACDDEEDASKPSARAIVEFGRSIDAWITDDGKVVTIAEWEAMLAAIHKSAVRQQAS